MRYKDAPLLCRFTNQRTLQIRTLETRNALLKKDTMIQLACPCPLTSKSEINDDLSVQVADTFDSFMNVSGLLRIFPLPTVHEASPALWVS